MDNRLSLLVYTLTITLAVVLLTGGAGLLTGDFIAGGGLTLVVLTVFFLFYERALRHTPPSDCPAC